MNCPKCNNKKTKVNDSRIKEDFIVKRRRECLSCGRKFNSYEIVPEEENFYETIKKVKNFKKNKRYYSII